MNRVIFFGRIEFENERSISLARDAYVHFHDNLAKNDLIFKLKDLFREDNTLEPDQLSFDFPRTMHNDVPDKMLDQTITSLRKLLDFAIAGRIEIFRIGADVVERLTLHTLNDKSVPQRFLAGRLALEAGAFRDAIEHFDEVLRKHKNHAWALDARGHAYLALSKGEDQNLQKAEQDFQASLQLHNHLASAHYGMARIHFLRKKWSATFDACRQAMDVSIPHQPGYWITALLNVDASISQLEQNPPKDAAVFATAVKQTQNLLNRYARKLESLPVSNPCEFYEDDDHSGIATIARPSRGGLVLNNSLLEFQVINSSLFPSEELHKQLQRRLDSLEFKA